MGLTRKSLFSLTHLALQIMSFCAAMEGTNLDAVLENARAHYNYELPEHMIVPFGQDAKNLEGYRTMTHAKYLQKVFEVRQDNNERSLKDFYHAYDTAEHHYLLTDLQTDDSLAIAMILSLSKRKVPIDGIVSFGGRSKKMEWHLEQLVKTATPKGKRPPRIFMGTAGRSELKYGFDELNSGLFTGQQPEHGSGLSPEESLNLFKKEVTEHLENKHTVAFTALSAITDIKSIIDKPAYHDQIIVLASSMINWGIQQRTRTGVRNQFNWGLGYNGLKDREAFLALIQSNIRQCHVAQGLSHPTKYQFRYLIAPESIDHIAGLSPETAKLFEKHSATPGLNKLFSLLPKSDDTPMTYQHTLASLMRTWTEDKIGYIKGRRPDHLNLATMERKEKLKDNGMAAALLTQVGHGFGTAGDIHLLSAAIPDLRTHITGSVSLTARPVIHNSQVLETVVENKKVPMVEIGLTNEGSRVNVVTEHNTQAIKEVFLQWFTPLVQDLPYPKPPSHASTS